MKATYSFRPENEDRVVAVLSEAGFVKRFGETFIGSTDYCRCDDNFHCRGNGPRNLYDDKKSEIKGTDKLSLFIVSVDETSCQSYNSITVDMKKERWQDLEEKLSDILI